MRVAITGGCGFIGSNMVKYLNELGVTDIDIFDYETEHSRWKNLVGLKYKSIESPNKLFQRVRLMVKHKDSGNWNCGKYDAIIALGAWSQTTLENTEDNYINNFNYMKEVFRLSRNFKIIFASSASIYGLEEEDFTERLNGLTPINFYAYTKYKCEEILSVPSFQKYCNMANIYSLRFFNVYGGKREQYKGSQASVIYKWMTQRIDLWDKLKLFKSPNQKYKDGEQARDFVYVRDVCDVIRHCIVEPEGLGGVYNVGSGVACTWLQVAKEILIIRGIANLNNWKDYIEFVDMPKELEDQYQYYTKADLNKLRYDLKYPGKITYLTQGIYESWQDFA